jgi:prepilin-type N-terminal cleavage/methylation domain-containing protein
MRGALIAAPVGNAAWDGRRPTAPKTEEIKPLMKRSFGFTLIELLIVVAIIAILAAIAVPNFLEAQIRSKTSRSKSDMRSLATAIESYYVDNNSYPQCNSFGLAGRRQGAPEDANVQQSLILERISTPVAYMSSAFIPDAFKARKRSGGVINGSAPPTPAQADWRSWTNNVPNNTLYPHLYETYQYHSMYSEPSETSGMDRAFHPGFGPPFQSARAWILQSAGPMEAYINMGGVIANSSTGTAINFFYDPTNGTISFGNIFRTGGAPLGANNFLTAAGIHGNK